MYSNGVLRVHRLPVGVVAVGNLSTGGTGKTPLCELVLQHLSAMGLQAAYLSRGYGRRSRGFLLVDAQHHTAADVGDEALQVASNSPGLPVAVCANRVEGVQELLRRFPDLDVVVLDDALQHRRIHRDLNILSVDATRPPWQDWLLPVGNLREPWHQRRRAQLVVVNKSQPLQHDDILRQMGPLPTAFSHLNPVALQALWGHGPDLDPHELAGRPVLAFSGLANNAHFAATLRRLGLQLLHHHCFADHHPYTPAELDRLVQHHAQLAERHPNLLLLTSQKDAMRLLHGPPQLQLHLPARLPLYALRAALEIGEGRRNFDAALQALAHRPWKLPASKTTTKP